MSKIITLEELRTFLADIAEWQDKTFPSANSLSKIAHLIEEIVELKNEIIYGNISTVKLEFADCFLLLFGAALKEGISLDEILEAMQNKMNINRYRSWESPDENGIIRHIKS